MKRILSAFWGLAILLILVVAAGPRVGMSPTMTRDTGLSNDFSDRMGGTDTEGDFLFMSGYPLYFNINYEESDAIAAYPGGANQWYRDQAANDLLIWQVWPLVDPDSAWTVAFDSVRFYNPTIPILGYINVFGARYDWHESADFPHLADLYAALAADDSAGFMKIHDGALIGNGAGDAHVINKTPTFADTVAFYYNLAIAESPTFTKWTGFFLDFIDYPTTNTWFCCGGGSAVLDSIDLNQNSTPWSGEPEVEQPLFQGYYDTLLVKLTAGLTAARGGRTDFLMIGNGAGADKAAMAPFLDYVFFETVTEVDSKSRAMWLDHFNTTPGLLNSTRTSKRFGFYEADVDSGFYTMEALAMIGIGAGNTWHGSGDGRQGGPPLRKLTHNFGNPIGDATVVAIDADSAIAVREFDGGTASVVVHTDSGDHPPPWQYLIVTSAGDTLSRRDGAGSNLRRPATPTNLAVTSLNTEAYLNWDDNVEPDLLHYRTYWSLSDGGPYTLSDTVTASIDTVTGLNDDTLYYFVTVAFDSTGNFSKNSNQDSATTGTPAAPTALLAEGGDDFVTLEWDGNTESDLASYNVYRDTVSGSLVLHKTGITSPGITWTDTFVTNDSTYYYSVTAVDASANESAESSEVNATPTGSSFTWTYADNRDQYTTAPDTIADGTLTVDLSLGTSQSAYVRAGFRRHDGAYAAWTDTTPYWRTPADTEWLPIRWETGIPVANTNADSGGIDLAWSDGTGEDHYHLHMRMLSAYGVVAVDWTEVDTTIAANDTTYTHDQGTPGNTLIEPRRGRLEYRLYGALDHAGDDSLSAVALIDSIFYNQAIGVYSTGYAIQDTASATTPIATPEMGPFVYISRQPPPAPPVALYRAVPLAKEIAQNIAAVVFTDSSTNTPTGWAWDFGDSSTDATTQNPTHNYSAAGTYTTSLWASNTGGADEELKTNYIAISADTTPADTSGSGIWLTSPGITWGDTTNANARLTISMDMDGTPDELVASFTQYRRNAGDAWTPVDSTAGGGYTTPSSTTWLDTINTLDSLADIYGSGPDTVYVKTTIRDMATATNELLYPTRRLVLARQSTAADDTIGYSDPTDTYTNQHNIGGQGSDSYGARIVMTEDGTITKLHVYLTGVDTAYEIEGAIYTDDGGDDGTLVAEGALSVASGGADGWHEIDLDVSYGALDGAALYVFFKAEDDNVFMNSDVETAGSPNIAWYESMQWSNFPLANVTSAGTYTTRRLAVYVTYE